MGSARAWGAVLGMLVAGMLVFAGPAVANPGMDDDSSGSDSSGDDSSSGGCPPAGCVNVYTPAETSPGHSDDDDSPSNSHDGDSSDSSPTGGSSSGGCSGCGGQPSGSGDHHPAVTPDATPDAVVIVPKQRPAPPVRRAAPAPAADPGANFVPAAPAPIPVLEQAARSRGAGEVVPAAERTELPPEDQTGGDGSVPWALLVPAVAVMAAGAGLAFAPRRVR